MEFAIDDCSKRRLVERDDIVTAVNILRSRGVDLEDLIVEISRIFYVDLDEFNEVLRAA